MKKFFTNPIVIVATIISSILIIYCLYIYMLLTNNSELYYIKYFDNNSENQITYAIKIINKDRNCITFINEFKMETTICAENIAYVKIK